MSEKTAEYTCTLCGEISSVVVKTTAYGNPEDPFICIDCLYDLNLVRYEILPYYDHIYELLFGVKYMDRLAKRIPEKKKKL